ncbi:serine O-acetyltransferase [Halotalea alkalilenta]|uniref:serine O-acetyltransferase n=1 Tax=Halotalea alkalilenta TaxID=376489 RepID=UPI0009EED0AC|nr:serine acetyltransferase [Halotalea alkalilenta]
MKLNKLKYFMEHEGCRNVGRFAIIKATKNFFIGSSSRKVVLRYRLACYFSSRAKFLTTYILKKLQRTYGVYISSKADIGAGLILPHPNGVVIGEKVIIGKNCTIYQQVTLGGGKVGDQSSGNYPVIGDNVTIYAGAKVLGSIKIGDNVIIGANAVIIKDVPSKAVAVGVPGKNILREDNQ